MKNPFLFLMLMLVITGFNGLLHYEINKNIGENFVSIKSTNTFVRVIEDDLDDIKVDNEIMSFVVCYTINEFDSLKNLKKKCEQKIDFILEKMDSNYFITPVLIDSSSSKLDSVEKLIPTNIIIRKSQK